MNKSVLKIKLLNIDNDGYHLALKAKVNGKVAQMLIDTGASRTVFDLNRIGKFFKSQELQENERLSTGLGTNTMKSHVAELKKMVLGEIIIEKYKAIFLDLSHVNESYVNAGLNPIDGVIGSDILHDHQAVIDYSKMELVLRKKQLIKQKKKHVAKRRR